MTKSGNFLPERALDELCDDPTWRVLSDTITIPSLVVLQYTSLSAPIALYYNNGPLIWDLQYLSHEFVKLPVSSTLFLLSQLLLILNHQCTLRPLPSALPLASACYTLTLDILKCPSLITYKFWMQTTPLPTWTLVVLIETSMCNIAKLVVV